MLLSVLQKAFEKGMTSKMLPSARKRKTCHLLSAVLLMR